MGARLESIHSKYEHELPSFESTASATSNYRNTEHPHILVVDDNEELRNFLKESLNQQYHITEA